MSAEISDRKFFDSFMAVLALLVLFTLGMAVLAGAISKRSVGVTEVKNPVRIGDTLARVQPLGTVVVAGESSAAGNSLLAAVAPPPAAQAATAVAAAPTLDPTDGKAVYDLACTACHTAGIAGAPKIGEANQWSARVAQGIATLQQHAIVGYQGDAGYMPPRGGNASLSDEAVISAVDYMVDQLN